MRIPSIALAFACTLFTSGCNRRVFQFIEPSCDRTIPVDIEIPLQRAADILIVVDNSGSMAEEQQKLADNFINLRCADPDDASTCECPLQALAAIPDEFKNPQPSLYEGDGPLSKCGFIQLLAAFENDFRVGVITTDVGPCDNRFAQFGETDFRPQRGCLQPDGPARAGARLFMSRKDLLDDGDAGNEDLAGRFSATLANIGTRGTGFERGLDAMEIFLDPDAVRAPECTDDLASFRRNDAQLVTIFLTDEEDCSHADGDLGFLDEGTGIVCGENEATIDNSSAARCYPPDGQSTAPGLAPIDRYVAALRAADADAKIAVIAGIVNEGGEPVASSCSPAEEAGAAPVLDCWESHGSSNETGPNGICGDSPPEGDARTIARAGRPCCIADRGDRYVELAQAVGSGSGARLSLLDSICEQSFRKTMLDIAALVGSTNTVDLVEPPAGGVIVVTMQKSGASEESVVPRLANAAACAAETGFLLDGQRVIFCNDAIPQPGDQVHIRAKGEATTPQCQTDDE